MALTGVAYGMASQHHGNAATVIDAIHVLSTCVVTCAPMNSFVLGAASAARRSGVPMFLRATAGSVALLSKRAQPFSTPRIIPLKLTTRQPVLALRRPLSATMWLAAKHRQANTTSHPHLGFPPLLRALGCPAPRLGCLLDLCRADFCPVGKTNSGACLAHRLPSNPHQVVCVTRPQYRITLDRRVNRHGLYPFPTCILRAFHSLWKAIPSHQNRC